MQIEQHKNLASHVQGVISRDLDKFRRELLQGEAISLLNDVLRKPTQDIFQNVQEIASGNRDVVLSLMHSKIKVTKYSEIHDIKSRLAKPRVIECDENDKEAASRDESEGSSCLKPTTMKRSVNEIADTKGTSQQHLLPYTNH